MRIKFSTNIIIQILAMAIQALNGIGQTTPDEYKPIIAGLITIIQGTVALVSHFSNPDGTSVRVPYQPK